MIDPHCPNVLMFHFALRNKILNHELVKTAKLIVQVLLFLDLKCFDFFSHQLNSRINQVA
jgi:hypothetical protein